MPKKNAPAESSEQQLLLDSVFSALADPVRRSILVQLQAGPLLVTELAAPFEISIQAVSRHIQVLEDAGLVQKERTGRIRRCTLDVGPIFDVVTWLNRYSRYWQDQFAQLSSTLEEAKPEPEAKRARKPAARRNKG